MRFKQNLEQVSLFNFFLWIFLAGFAMILSTETVWGAEKLYTARGKRDPFVPLVSAGSKPSATGGLAGVETIEEIVVEGIVFDKNPKNSVVVLNGTVLATGQELGSVKVLKIEAERALISINGIEGYKSLYQEETKKEEE